MQHVLARDALVLKNLDGYHVWPVKHRHWIFDMVEDEGHDLWISCEHLRNFYAKFPSDHVLKGRYERFMLFDKSTRKYYLPVRFMRGELLKSKPYSAHTDVLKFLDWFERNVLRAIEKKRSYKHLDAKNSERDALALTVTGPLPLASAHPRFSETTSPLTPQERWALESADPQVPRVFHAKTIGPRVSWTEHWRGLARRCARALRGFALGRRNYAFTWVVVLFAVWRSMDWTASLLLPASLDWTTSYHRVAWSYAILALLALLWSCAYAAVMTCGLVWRWKQRKNVVPATVFYGLVIGVAPLIAAVYYDTDMVHYWYSSVMGRYRPMTVYADPHLGRIVAQGAMWFGSAEELESVITKNPKYTLLELQSPGGFVVEGFRMARLVQDHKMDTVALDYCASACTLVLVAGNERYLGDDVEVGFHRSGTFSNHEDYGWSQTDYRIAEHFRAHGVKQSFIEVALKLPMWEVWYAPHPDMYEAGYATGRWFDRKPGY